MKLSVRRSTRPTSVAANQQDIWVGAITIAVVVATFVWALRLALPWGPWTPGVPFVAAFAGLALTLVVGAIVVFRSFPVTIGLLVVLSAATAFAVHDAITRSGWVVATLVGFVGVAFLAAWQWSTRWMRGTLVVFLTLALLMTLRVGKLELDDDRARDARAEATRLYGEIPKGPARRTAAEQALDDAKAAVVALCTGGLGRPNEGPDLVWVCDAPTLAGSEARVGARALVVLERRAEQRVAAAKATSSGGAAEKKALEKAQLALATALAEIQDPASTHSVTETLAAGARRVLRSVPLLGGDRVPMALGLLEWSAVGALALLGYRRLEIVNRASGRGLVKINALKGGDEEANRELDAVFRRHVLSNVAEPGVIPGGSGTSSVTDLLGVTDPVKLLSKLVSAIGAIAAVAPRFEVDGTYHAPAAGNDPETSRTGEGSESGAATVPRRNHHHVFVRLRDPRTGATLSTTVEHAPTADLALRSAGYWVAWYVIRHDPTTPVWARWTEESTAALAAYDEAVDLDEPAVAEQRLREALELAPGSGLLLAKLASALELKSKPVEALELHLRAATCHPRYPVARYRVAMSLAAVAARHPLWVATPVAAQQRFLDALGRCAAVCRIKCPPPKEPSAIGSSQFAEWAEAFRLGACDLFERRSVVVLSLRRSERRYWAPLLLSDVGRQRRKAAWKTINTAGYAVRERIVGDPKPEPDGDDRGARWQALYNLACYYAVRSGPTGANDRKVAVQLLERTLEADLRGQLTKQWVDNDPDLENLRGHARFEGFRQWLPAEPSSATTREESA